MLLVGVLAFDIAVSQNRATRMGVNTVFHFSEVVTVGRLPNSRQAMFGIDSSNTGVLGRPIFRHTNNPCPLYPPKLLGFHALEALLPMCGVSSPHCAMRSIPAHGGPCVWRVPAQKFAWKPQGTPFIWGSHVDELNCLILVCWGIRVWRNRCLVWW